MSQQFHDTPEPDPTEIPRAFGRALATVFLPNDAMRIGKPAKLFDLATGRLGLQMESPPALGEVISIHLENHIQRVDRTVRGVVREVFEIQSELFRIRVELSARLSPMDVLLLKTSISDDGTDKDKTRWL